VGGGLIGSRAALELAGRDCETTVFSRSFSPLLVEADHKLPLRLIEGVVPPGDELERLIEETDAVLFLAGSSTPLLSEQNVARSIAGLLEPALTVLATMRDHDARRIVIASSGGTVYGRVETLPTPESEPTAPISVHGVNCLATEQYAGLYARQHGLEPVILRLSNVYGPGQRVRGGLGVVAAWCTALATGEPVQLIGDGSVRRDFLYVDDAGRAVVEALGAPPGIYNAGSGESTSLSELLEMLAEVSGVGPRVERLPPRAIDVPVTQLDSTLLREATGWEPRVDLREGLRQCWEWATAHSSARTASTTRSP